MTTTEHSPAEHPADGHHPATSPVDQHGRLDPTHYGLGPDDAWPEDVPTDQDDTWWRFRDDPRGARRAELKVAACWMLPVLAGIGLALTYVLGGQPQAEGILLFFGFGGLAAGLVIWARDLLPGQEVTASRGHHASSSPHMRKAVTESLTRATEPMARRPFLLRMLGLVGGVFGLGALFPIASLGPRPHGTLLHTGWSPGVRVVTIDNRPLRPTDVNPDGILTVFPENQQDQAQSATVLINVGNAKFRVQPGRESWIINGVVAFSKICTHAGCPVGLYDVQTHQLVCPCHQSTFDLLLDCKPVFGPAPRSLPQLALAVDQDGYLIAQGDYDQPVGPGFWNRG